jgi:hypothetical protein
MKIAVQLLDQAWPLEPLRSISVKLMNLKDDKGNTSESATEVTNRTGGSLKLGGNPKETLPKLIRNVFESREESLDERHSSHQDAPVHPTGVAKIIHHNIQQSLFQPDEAETEEKKKAMLKDYYMKKNYYKKV